MLHQNLIAELRACCGDDAVIDAPEALRPYSHDWMPGDYQLPLLVVLPGEPEQIATIVRLAGAAGLPVVARGAGTGLAGGARPLRGGLVIATLRLQQIEQVDRANRSVRVQPGLINYELSAALLPQGWFYAPDPASWKLCTLGGNIANNSGGPRCLKYGVTTNHVLAVELALHDGRTLWTGDGVQDAAGYDLTGLIVGSEGTFGVVTRALLRLTRAPEANRVALALFLDVVAACAAVSAILAAGHLPTALEVMDALTMLAVNRAQGAGLPEEAGAALIIEVDGVVEGLDETLAELVAICRAHGALSLRTATTAAEQEQLWSARRSAFASFHTLAPAYHLVDTVVPRTRLPTMMAHVQRLSREYAMPIANVFHAGDGNLHPLVLYDPADPAQLLKAYAITAEVLNLSIAEGGTVSGEHGIGVEKQDFLARLYSPAELEAQAAVYAVFNPQSQLNPGKIFPVICDPLELATARQVRLAASYASGGRATLAVGLEKSVGADYVLQGAAAAAYAVQGLAPAYAVLPANLDELAATMAACYAAGATVTAWGGGTQQALGCLAAAPEVVVVTRRLGGVRHYTPDDLTIGVGAGMTLDELQTLLAEHGQLLPLAAPRPTRATLGGLVATAADGPLRLGHGTLRDLVLGLTVVQVDGTVIRVGGQVVKNVSGYELVKLFVGSHGTLGVLAEVRLRTYPRPRHAATLVAGFASRMQALAYLDELAASVLRPDAAEYLDAAALNSVGLGGLGHCGVALRFAGAAAACARQVGESTAVATLHGALAFERREGALLGTLWGLIADLAAVPDDAAVGLLRLAVPPAELGVALGELEGAANSCGLELRVSARALSGVIYAQLVGTAEARGALLARLGTHYRHAHLLAGTLPDAAAGLRWGQPHDPLAYELMMQLKAAFDPFACLNRGRWP